jgi:hypothetical protein
MGGEEKAIGVFKKTKDRRRRSGVAPPAGSTPEASPRIFRDLVDAPLEDRNERTLLAVVVRPPPAAPATPEHLEHSSLHRAKLRDRHLELLAGRRHPIVVVNRVPFLRQHHVDFASIHAALKKSADIFHSDLSLIRNLGVRGHGFALSAARLDTLEKKDRPPTSLKTFLGIISRGFSVG